MKQQFLLYLAGPITGMSYGDCTDWRHAVASKLPAHIVGVSPLRGAKYLAQEKAIADSYEHRPLSSQKGITCICHMDVKRADMVLVNFLGAEKISIGSVMEIAWADAHRKPLIIVMDEKNLHNYAMIRDVAGFIVPTLDEAVDIAIRVLSPTVD